jgi:threonine dehydrogenase-like Zn-dependent dehydrogenase
VTIRALTFQGKGDVRYETRPDPTPPDAHGAVLKVERAAICGSDLHLYHAALPMADVGFAIGHEFVGEVVEVGSAVRDFQVGDRVLTSGVIGCGLCGSCRAGRVVRCEARQTRVFGMGSALPGGQAEAVAVPGADHAFKKIPDGVSVEQAVLLTDILPTAYYGALQADIRPGDTVAVIGLGPVGLLAVECARLFGPARVLAIDRIPERLKQAEALGAEPVHLDKAPEVAAAANGGMGPDAVIEAVGADASIQMAIAMCRVAGTVSVIGVSMNFAFPFPMPLALMKDLTFRIGICPIPELWSALVPLVQAGRLHPERVFTHHLGLSQGAEAYKIFDEKREGVLKVLLDPAR